MPDLITVTGLVATNPTHLVTGEGLPITSFRLASTQRRYDRKENRWVDGDTNWYTITAFRNLALNSNVSVQKGQRVLVAGRLKVREWTKEDRKGTNVDIDADAIGHDLAWGTAAYTRNLSSSLPRGDDTTTGDPGSVQGGADTPDAWAAPMGPPAPIDETDSRSEAADAPTPSGEDDELAVPF